MSATEDDDDDRTFRDISRSVAPMSGFMAIICGVLMVVGIEFEPRAELGVAPIYRSYRIPPESVTRTGQNLCWTRTGEKLRNPPLVDIDITVDYISNKTGKLAHQPTPALFIESTGDDFTTDDIAPPGPFSSRVCIRLASTIKPDQPVQVRQTAYFGSITTLWTVPFFLPTIVFPSGSANVFAKHDTSASPEDHAVAGPKPVAPGQRSDADTLDDVRQGIAEMAGPQIDSADDGPMVRMDTTISTRDAARVEQSRVGHGDRSRRAALRRLIPRALDDEDRDALGPYEPGK